MELEYTVRSAYQCVMDQLRGDTDNIIQGNWNVLWNLQVPQHVKHYLWRACRNVLPTRTRLQDRGVEVSGICPLCNSNLENTWHLMVTCNISKQCWQQINVWGLIEQSMERVKSFPELFWYLLEQLECKKRSLVAMVMWGLWKARNDKVWEEKNTLAADIIHKSRSVLFDWIQANNRYLGKPQTDTRGIIRWTHPPAGFVKCNIDAAFFQQQRCFGDGMCLRDEQGCWISAATAWFDCYPKVHEGEAIGLWRGIQWLNALGVQKYNNRAGL